MKAGTHSETTAVLPLWEPYKLLLVIKQSWIKAVWRIVEASIRLKRRYVVITVRLPSANLGKPLR